MTLPKLNSQITTSRGHPCLGYNDQKRNSDSSHCTYPSWFWVDSCQYKVCFCISLAWQRCMWCCEWHVMCTQRDTKCCYQGIVTLSITHIHHFCVDTEDMTTFFMTPRFHFQTTLNLAPSKEVVSWYLYYVTMYESPACLCSVVCLTFLCLAHVLVVSVYL